MLIRSDLAVATPARVAHPPQDAAIHTPDQRLAAHAAPNHTAAEPNPIIRHAILGAGILLAAVSVALAASAGWSRGATQLESVVWSGAGIALAIVSLTGLAAALTCSGAMRRVVFAAWVLSLAFVVVSGLGSQHSGRELAARADTGAESQRARHETAYRLAEEQLATLPLARPGGVITAEIERLNTTPGLASCDDTTAPAYGPISRRICAELAPLRTELANAQAREAAQHAMATATTALAGAPTTTPANSDAAALAHHLAAVGIVVSVERLADVISLLIVVSIELVGAVAIAFGRRSMTDAPSALQPATAKGVQAGPRDGGALQETAPVNMPPALGVQAPERRPVNAETTDTIERLKARILGDLEHGPRACSQRALAGELGVSVGYVNRVLKELASGGRVNVAATRAGTRLELAMA